MNSVCEYLAHIPNYREKTPIQLASENGYHEIVKILAHASLVQHPAGPIPKSLLATDLQPQNLEESESDDSEDQFRVEEAAPDEHDAYDPAFADLNGKDEFHPITTKLISTIQPVLHKLHKTVNDLMPKQTELKEDGSGGRLQYDPQKKEWVLLS